MWTRHGRWPLSHSEQEGWLRLRPVRRKLRLDGASRISPYRRPSSTSVGRRGKTLIRHPGGADECRTAAGSIGYIVRRRSWALDRRGGSGHGYIATPSWEQKLRLNTAGGEPMEHKSAPPINPPSGPCPDPSHFAVDYPRLIANRKNETRPGTSTPICPPRSGGTPPGHATGHAGEPHRWINTAGTNTG